MPYRARTHLPLRPLVPLIIDAPPPRQVQPSFLTRAMRYISTACTRLGTSIGIMQQPRYRQQQRREVERNVMREVGRQEYEPTPESWLKHRKQGDGFNAGEDYTRDRIIEPQIYKLQRAKSRRHHLTIQVLNEIHLYEEEMPFRRNKRNAPVSLYSRFEQNEKKLARPLSLLNHRRKLEVDDEQEAEPIKAELKGFGKVVNKAEEVEDQQAMTQVHQDDLEERPGVNEIAPQAEVGGTQEENEAVDLEEDKQSEVKEDEKALPEKPKLFQKQTEEEKQSSSQSTKPAGLFGSSFMGIRKNEGSGFKFPSFEKKEISFPKPQKSVSTPEKSEEPITFSLFGKSNGTKEATKEVKEEKPKSSLFSGFKKPFASGSGGDLFKIKAEKKEEQEQQKKEEQKEEKKEEKKQENTKDTQPKSSFFMKPSAGFPKFSGSFIVRNKEQSNFFQDDNQFAENESDGKAEQDEQKEKKEEKPKPAFTFSFNKQQEDSKPATEKPQSLFGGNKAKGAIATETYTLFGKKHTPEQKTSSIKKTSLFQTKSSLFQKPSEPGKGFTKLFENSKGNLFPKQLFGKSGNSAAPS